MRILIVDDEPLALTILRRYLQQWGHDVVSAPDGAEALKLFEREPFPMLITDWTMPEMSGIELIRRVRAHPRGAPAYVVLLTGRAAKEDVVAGMEAGADDFLAKPFDRDELRVRVHEGERIVELERRRTRAEAHCERMQATIAQCSRTAERDLDRALALLHGLDGGTEHIRDEAIAYLASARNLFELLRADADTLDVAAPS